MSTALQEESSINEPYYIDDDDNEALSTAEIDNAPDDTTTVDLDAGDDLQIEIEDDTPDDDQGRAPLPQHVKDDLEEDTEQYSENVKKRISQMRKAYHDERREKEEAFRERDAATNIANGAYQQQQTLQNQLSVGQEWAIEQATQRGLLAAETAKQKLAMAIEDGDVEGQTEAQMELSQAQQFQMQVSQMRMREPQPQQSVAQPQQQAYTQPQVQRPQAPPRDMRAQEWADKNSEWFGDGKNEDMTNFAVEVHHTLVQNGVSPQTDEYYDRLNHRLHEKYPAKFGGKKAPPSTVVSPAGRTPQGKRVVLTRSEVKVAEAMGITNAQYAREKMKMGNV